MRDFIQVDTDDVGWEPAPGDILTKSYRHLRFMMRTDTTLVLCQGEGKFEPTQKKESVTHYLLAFGLLPCLVPN